MERNFDIEASCKIYAQSVEHTMDQLFDLGPATVETPTSIDSLATDENIYFSILFTGKIYGEFLIGINRRTALKILNKNLSDKDESLLYEESRSEILDTFKEIINIAAGTTLSQIKQVFPEVSITPPRAIEGQLTLSHFNIKKSTLVHSSGLLSCYIYVDYMKLDVANALQKSQDLLNEEHQKQEELQRLNRAKTEFLANMSHELRTPLNGMIGMLDLLKSTQLNDLQTEQVNVICRSGDFLLSIINDILEFAKIESGKLTLEKRPFLLRDCIESVAEGLATEVFAKGLDFNVIIDPRIQGHYLGDDTRIKQVLVNLVGNALKFTPTGSISIASKILDNGKIEIRVSDTGVGIPASKLRTIFESFSQAEVSDKRKYGGSGLGLTISKSIMDAMGGSIQVLSEEAKGSHFILQFPLDVASEKVTSANSLSTIIESKSIILFTDRKLLAETAAVYLKHAHQGGAQVDLKIDSDLPNDVQTIGASQIILDYRLLDRHVSKDKIEFLNKLDQLGCYILILVRPKDIHSLGAIFEKTQFQNINYATLPISFGRLIKTLQEQPVAAKSKNKEVASLAQQDEPAVIGKKKSVLLVEDVAVNQMVASAMLKNLGYEVTLANNGNEAVTQYQKARFDLILMDCQMPEKDGYEATTEIRQLEKEKTYKTPIIALTANAFREIKEKCFETGMDDFMTKPFKIDDLKQTLERVLRAS